MSKCGPPFSDYEPDIKNWLAKRLLPIKDCCGSGCKKCNYGRWLKRRPRTWPVLIDECLKRTPPWLWGIGLLVAFAAGYLIGAP